MERSLMGGVVETRRWVLWVGLVGGSCGWGGLVRKLTDERVAYMSEMKKNVQNDEM